MEYRTLKINDSGLICLLTISRPEAMNALNSLFFTELNDFLDWLENNMNARVLVITGEGKSFVAGADISEMSEMSQEDAYLFSQTGQRTFDRLENLRIPVIAAINGYALGGGCELAMACDFRIASNKAKFGQVELNLGLIPGYAGTQRLSRLTGLGNALFLILTGEMITADDALRINLVQKVTEAENLMEEVMKYAGKLAENGSLAAIKAKSVIRNGYNMEFQMACDIESQEFGSLFDEAPTKEGMKAFLEKRKPAW